MNRISKIAAMLLCGLLLIAACGNKKNEKEITIGYANWAEGIAITRLVQTIFEEQGYKVVLKNADPAPIYASMANKKVDVFLDAWLPTTHEDYMKQYGNKLEVLGDIYSNARIGLVVPSYVTINSIEELNADKAKFDDKIIGIDAGAGIMKATDKAIEDYKLDYKLMESSGPAMTAVLKKAIDNKQWIVITGWTPHWMFSRYALKFLADPKGVYGKAENVEALAYKGFGKADPFAAKLISNIKMNDEEISSLMSIFADNEMDEQGAAKTWIREHRALVDSWIPKESHN